MNKPISVRALPLADIVYMSIHARIMRGEYHADERLPAENDLAEHFGVSRPVLRKAIERLRGEGLIESRQGSGNFVRAAGHVSVQFSRVQTIADIQRCYEFRAAIETEAAALAAQRRDDARLAEMREAYSLLAEGPVSLSVAQDADFSFHRSIAAGSNNAYFVDTLEMLRSHIYVGMKLRGAAGPANRALQPEAVRAEHRAILDAIEARDAEGARRAMKTHITQSRTRLFGGSLIDLTGAV